MKFSKRALSLIVAIAMIIGVFAVGAFTAAAGETTYSLVENKDNIKTVGRVTWLNSGVACDWTASGIEFAANCSGDVKATINASLTCPTSGAAAEYTECFFTVYVDGVRKDERLRLTNGEHTVTFASDLAAGNHTFKLVKQNDMVNNKTVIESVTVNGTLNSKPSESERIIEFIGDSITVGFGSLNTNDARSRYSDGTRTYAYLTAENFGAEARVTAVSGGTIASLYNEYIYNCKARNSSAELDFSAYKKPSAVVLEFGTNDGAKTVEYWQTNIKKYADFIRGGYGDNNIPLVFIHNLITNSDSLRSNVVSAIKNLEVEDATAYGKIYVTSGSNPQGGHPGQESHRKAANKLSQFLVNEGIMPISALKSDATVTLTAVSNKTVVLNSLDTTPSVSASGITAESVAPLDPASEGNENAKAAKFTADGTQTAVTDYRYPHYTFGTVTNTNYRSKGISFYINYKDLSGSATPVKPTIMVTQNDKKASVALDVEDGVTTKVTLEWDTMPYVNYVFNGFINGSNPGIKLDLGTNACEYTIDNITVINNDYSYTNNASSSYQTSTSFSIIGVTDGYEAATTTAATTTAATTTSAPSTTVATTAPTTGSSTPDGTTAPSGGDKIVSLVDFDNYTSFTSVGKVSGDASYGQKSDVNIGSGKVAYIVAKSNWLYIKLPAGWNSSIYDTPKAIQFDAGIASENTINQFQASFGRSITTPSTANIITLDKTKLSTTTTTFTVELPSDFSGNMNYLMVNAWVNGTPDLYIDNISLVYDSSATNTFKHVNSYETMYDWETDMNGVTASGLTMKRDSASAWSSITDSTYGLTNSNGSWSSSNRFYIAMKSDMLTNAVWLRVAVKTNRNDSSNPTNVWVTVDGVTYKASWSNFGGVTKSYTWASLLGVTYTADDSSTLYLSRDNLYKVTRIGLGACNGTGCISIDDVQVGYAIDESAPKAIFEGTSASINPIYSNASGEVNLPSGDISGKTFVGWKDANDNLYKANTTVVITEDTTYTAVGIEFSLLDGASVRWSNEDAKSGIKFTTKVNKEDIAELISLNASNGAAFSWATVGAYITDSNGHQLDVTNDTSSKGVTPDFNIEDSTYALYHSSATEFGGNDSYLKESLSATSYITIHYMNDETATFTTARSDSRCMWNVAIAAYAEADDAHKAVLTDIYGVDENSKEYVADMLASGVWAKGQYDYSAGTIDKTSTSAAKRAYCDLKLAVTAGAQYKFSLTNGLNSTKYMFLVRSYAANGSFVSSAGFRACENADTQVVTIPSGVSYITLSMYTASESSTSVTGDQLATAINNGTIKVSMIAQ